MCWFRRRTWSLGIESYGTEEGIEEKLYMCVRPAASKADGQRTCIHRDNERKMNMGYKYGVYTESRPRKERTTANLLCITE